jgi:hypothetical protein
MYADGSPPKAEVIIVGGGVEPTPPKPEPPQPDPDATFQQQVATSLESVTSPNKTSTASGLARAYRELIKQADKATSAAEFSDGVNMLTGVIARGGGWDVFTTLLKSELAKAASVEQASDTLAIAATELEKVE